MTEPSLRQRTRPAQRAQQQPTGHAWNVLHSFGVHSHALIYITARATRTRRCR
jgi:hypothetical protein